METEISTPSIIDNSFYKQIVPRRGVLQIDQELALDPKTKPTVQRLANAPDFATRFGKAVVKLGAVGVLAGTQGEIRRSCRAINKSTRKLDEADVDIGSANVTIAD
ncbi:hypothetical protein Ancab_007545 [Ancistrocladus abbreviatus]